MFHAGFLLKLKNEYIRFSFKAKDEYIRLTEAHNIINKQLKYFF